MVAKQDLTDNNTLWVGGLSLIHIYTDMYWISTATVRVVCRGDYYANANGGVSYAYANSDASNTNASVGSRLAFRGKIVRAQSVAAYKAIREVA